MVFFFRVEPVIRRLVRQEELWCTSKAKTLKVSLLVHYRLPGISFLGPPERFSGDRSNRWSTRSASAVTSSSVSALRRRSRHRPLATQRPTHARLLSVPSDDVLHTRNPGSRSDHHRRRQRIFGRIGVSIHRPAHLDRALRFSRIRPLTSVTQPQKPIAPLTAHLHFASVLA